MPEGQIGQTVYDSLGGFLSGENIPKKFWEYFDEYDPAKEQLLEQELGVDSKRKRFEFGQQKRQMLSQKSKMGFAGSGEMEAQQANIYDMFTSEMGLMGETTRLDIAGEKEDWLGAQYDMAASMADDIKAEQDLGNLRASDFVRKIYGRDNHWEKSHLAAYDDTSNERKFLRYSWDQGKAWMSGFKKWNKGDKDELKSMYSASVSDFQDVTEPKP